MKRKPIKITWPAFILTIAIIFLVGYSVVDATVQKPKMKDKIENISEDFDSLRIYLDGKIPYLEAAVIKHEDQLQDQQEQLKRINDLTASLKEQQ